MLQVIVIVVILGYGTYQLFHGNFGALMAAMPLLVIYYLFLTARRRKDGDSR